MGDIEVSLEGRDVRPGAEIRGSVRVGYAGRYDGVVVNAQILGASGLVAYRTCNGRDASHCVTRLFVARADMPGGRAEFTASTDHAPAEPLDVKFRASIIEQHKEIESGVAFARLSA